MRFLSQAACLALVGAGLAATPVLQAGAAPQPQAASPDRLVAELRQQAQGRVLLSREPSTGAVGFLRTPGGDLLPGKAARGERGATAKAEAFLDEYAPAFGAAPDELVRTEVRDGGLGTTVTFRQQHRGVPVFGSLLRAHVDEQGDLTAVNGFAAPDLSLDTTPTFSASEAGQRAVAEVRTDPPAHDHGSETDAEHAAHADEVDDLGDLRAVDPELVVYRLGLVNGEEGGESILAWTVEVTNGGSVRDVVVVDATTGKPVNRWSLVHGALDRELYEGSPADTDLVWSEGDALPGDLTQAQQDLVAATGESYWFFASVFGRDSYDGAGATMKTVNNDPRINCPNANWNGATTNYCNGVTSDDVVAHEWGHAYTEYTHGLIYQWQPGALNEAYSDIWGETVDLINGRQDEGEGDLTAVRPVGLCSSHSPALPLLTINAPSSIAKDCLTGGASFGEQLDGTGITGDVVAPTDAVEEGGTALDGCSPYDQDVTGKVVLVDRGLCPFTQKAEVATAEGAAALIIGNRDDAPIGMSGDDPSLVSTVSIGLTDRESIRTALAQGETVNVTMKDAGGDRVDSYRWLVGEKSDAFGGAIRDMWSPTCYGDPGKVSDAEYKCSTDDNGGVHSNSGVPNHGYALLVDGGTYNGTTVRGIGLEKAAHVYYRAMTEYQTPASDFTDHADALAASCADLTGQALNKLTVTEGDPGKGGTLTADDCAQVEAMAAAVELREEPVQCGFEPLLQPGTGAPCGPGTKTQDFWSEDFEDGLAGWTVANELVFGYEGDLAPVQWQADGSLPGGREGTAAFGPDPSDLGQCTGDTADLSGVTTLTGPEVRIRSDRGAQSPRLSFDHYVATETGYDGGNVKISVNGGDFAVVPAEAYTFNPPATLTSAAAGNTNPLAGEPGFTGTDGGELTGTWGTSVVDLTAAGVAPGDTVQVRFDMGRDGCGGLDGWYVDDVTMTVCKVVGKGAGGPGKGRPGRQG
ncbi:M4 family metallopeptidase [Nocardioides perillae]|uniref:Zn-dependent metalloprotease n=1 Tax=Nocardioides perillae TaxID=1119534 RepID=A0A7Y9RWZ3_9ACTN|nr:Zn-dependent metalloprotease [Nocardioides perillae]